MAVKGVGVDICSISRIREKIQKAEFKKKVFTEEEIVYADKYKIPERHYASSFAAKEAFAKAGKWGIGKIGFKNVWVERTDNGPVLKFSQKVQELLEKEKISGVHVSLSHDEGFAIAFVVIEGKCGE